jgi:hypothetical protein
VNIRILLFFAIFIASTLLGCFVNELWIGFINGIAAGILVAIFVNPKKLDKFRRLL